MFISQILYHDSVIWAFWVSSCWKSQMHSLQGCLHTYPSGDKFIPNDELALLFCVKMSGVYHWITCEYLINFHWQLKPGAGGSIKPCDKHLTVPAGKGIPFHCSGSYCWSLMELLISPRIKKRYSVDTFNAVCCVDSVTCSKISVVWHILGEKFLLKHVLRYKYGSRISRSACVLYSTIHSRIAIKTGIYKTYLFPNAAISSPIPLSIHFCLKCLFHNLLL